MTMMLQTASLLAAVGTVILWGMVAVVGMVEYGYVCWGSRAQSMALWRELARVSVSV